MMAYVAEINGEAIIAFRAEDYEVACNDVNGDESERGDTKTILCEYDRADGSPIWNGASEILVRAATAAEHKLWKRDSIDGALIEPNMGDDPNDYIVFLIPISDPLADEDLGEEAGAATHEARAVVKVIEEILIAADHNDEELTEGMRLARWRAIRRAGRGYLGHGH